jgi:hypothetical protein
VGERIRIIRDGDYLALYRGGRKIGEGKLNTVRVLEILGFDVAVDARDEGEEADDCAGFSERIDMETGEALDD